MSKLPSAETQLRTLKSEHKRVLSEYLELKKERDSYRARATKAEQEAAEWKRRFDILLTREDNR